MSEPLLSLTCRHRFASGFELDVALATNGPTTSLFGPSGSGKSSLLAVIAGLLRPDQGRVSFGGEVWFDSERRVWLPPEQRRVGMVFQEPLLFPHLSVEGNLRYGQRRRRRGTERIGLAKVIEVLELGDLLPRWPRSLSGGQRQRVSLARALLREPTLLLLDEPLVALDEPLRLRILAYLDRILAEWQIPTVYVSHNQAEVRRLAHQVIVLREGRVVEAGTTDEVLARLSVSELNGAFGPMNLVRLEPVTGPPGSPVQGRLGHQFLVLPDSPQVVDSGHLYVQFAPQAVTLSTVPAAESLSVRNCLAGKVERLVEHAGRVLVLVDVGQPIWAEVTAEAVGALNLRPGWPVFCLVKSTALRVID